MRSCNEIQLLQAEHVRSAANYYYVATARASPLKWRSIQPSSRLSRERPQNGLFMGAETCRVRENNERNLQVSGCESCCRAMGILLQSDGAPGAAAPGGGTKYALIRLKINYRQSG